MSAIRIFEDETFSILSLGIRRNVLPNLDRIHATQVQALCRTFRFPAQLPVDEQSERITFNNGFFAPEDGSKGVAITVLTFGKHEIQTNILGGTTEHAERIIREAVALAHPATNWNTLLATIARKQYTTRTKVQLPFSMNRLLGRPIVATLNEAATIDGPYLCSRDGGAMVDVRGEDLRELAVGANPTSEVIVNAIKTIIRIKNPDTYKTLSYDVDILAESVEDALRGRYYVETELAFDKHIRLIELLIAHMEQDAQRTRAD